MWVLILSSGNKGLIVGSGDGRHLLKTLAGNKIGNSFEWFVLVSFNNLLLTILYFWLQFKRNDSMYIKSGFGGYPFSTRL